MQAINLIRLIYASNQSHSANLCKCVIIFGLLTPILDISVSNVTEATSFFRARIIMHDLLFTLCSIIVAIDCVFLHDLWCYVTGAQQRRRQRRRVLPHQDSSRPQ